MVKRVLPLVLYCLLMPEPGWGATLSAHVDRKQLYVGEQVLLTLSLTDSDTRLRAEGLDPNVDLTLLGRDFELGVPRSSHRYNIYRDRGRATSEIRVALFPRRSGDLQIPSFTVEGLSTHPITLHVVAPSPDPHPAVFVRSGTLEQHPWQGERVVAYLDLYHRVELKRARLGGDLDTEPKRLRLSPLPATERKVKVDGLQYQVTRSAWSITPVSPGKLQIHFPDVWVETAAGRRIRLPFADTTLEVRPLPAGVPPDILVGRPRLSQAALPRGGLLAGQPVPWQITLRAPADIQSLPGALPVEETPDFKIYFDLPAREWLKGNRGTPVAVAHYTAYVTPLRAGRLTLPGITLPYFDPRTGRTATATLPPATLGVAAPQATVSQEMPAVMAPQQPARVATPLDGGWPLATALFAGLWLITLLLWRYQRRAARAPGLQPSPGPDAGTNRALSSRPAMVRTLGMVLGSPSLELGLQTWERRHGPDPELRRLVRAIQVFHYAPEGKAADEATLQAALQAFLRRTAKEKAGATDDDPWCPEHFARKVTT